MGLLDSLAALFRPDSTRSHPDRPPAAMDHTHTCPYCQYVLPEVKGKRKCPECGEKLIRWQPDPDNSLKILVTAEQLKSLQRQRTREAAERTLRQGREWGHKRAEIIATLDRLSCKSCIEADGQVWPISKALAEMPIPHGEHEEGHCRCCWGVIVN